MRGRTQTVSAVVIILIGAMLRISMLARDVRLHPDEALYATYARSMALHGNWLLRDVVVALDKPPLGLSLTALGFMLTGIAEFSGRWPTVLISLIGLAAGYALAKRLYDGRTALLMLLLLALSPFEVAFAATLFHDPALMVWLTLTAWGLAYDKWRWAGIAAVLALWTKQSAIQFLPIFVLIGLSGTWFASWSWSTTWRFVMQFVLMVIIGIGLLAWWSSARAVPVDFWALGVINPGALRLIRSDEVLPRLERWIEMLGYAVGTAPMLVIALLPLVRSDKQVKAAITDAVIGLGVIGTLMVYWLLAYNLYDRYLLPLVVLSVMLMARGLRRLPLMATVIAVLIMLPMTWQALNSRIGIGVEADTARGIEVLAEHIRALPQDALIHQYWVDWELGFYLGDPAVTQLPRLVYQPSPEALVRFVCDHTDRRHYLALPSAMLPRWLAVMRDKTNITLSPMLAEQFSLYAIQCTTAVTPAED